MRKKVGEILQFQNFFLDFLVSNVFDKYHNAIDNNRQYLNLVHFETRGFLCLSGRWLGVTVHFYNVQTYTVLINSQLVYYDLLMCSLTLCRQTWNVWYRTWTLNIWSKANPLYFKLSFRVILCEGFQTHLAQSRHPRFEFNGFFRFAVIFWSIFC